MSHFKTSNLKRVFIAFFAAVLLNFLPFYFLNHLKLEIQTISHAHVGITSLKEENNFNESIIEKNIQLAKTFEIYSEPEQHLFDFEFQNETNEFESLPNSFIDTSKLIKKSPLLNDEDVLNQICLKGEVLSDSVSIDDESLFLKIGRPHGISNETYEVNVLSGTCELANFDPFEMEEAGILSDFEKEGIDLSNGAIASSEDFDIDLEYTPQKNNEGYLFKVSLCPKEDRDFQKIKHNITFLLDRSSSIKKNRFEISKQAILEALTHLSRGDTFNIIVFDKKITFLSESNLCYNTSNLIKAKNFLMKQKSGGILATTELYKSLKSIIPKNVAKNEVHTAILLSDGDTYLLPKKQRILINEWIKENKGKIALYCIAMKDHDNVALLDVLSTFNQGSIYTSNDIQDIPRTTKTLIEEIKKPIGKDIILTAIPREDKNKIEIGLTYAKSPNLYADKRYTFYGSINSLEDFYLFFQGRCYNKRINIRQYVDFKKGKLVTSPQIAKMWAREEANALYEKYLNFGKEEDLEKAKKILSTYKLPIAFL